VLQQLGQPYVPMSEPIALNRLAVQSMTLADAKQYRAMVHQQQAYPNEIETKQVLDELVSKGESQGLAAPVVPEVKAPPEVKVTEALLKKVTETPTLDRDSSTLNASVGCLTANQNSISDGSAEQHDLAAQHDLDQIIQVVAAPTLEQEAHATQSECAKEGSDTGVSGTAQVMAEGESKVEIPPFHDSIVQHEKPSAIQSVIEHKEEQSQQEHKATAAIRTAEQLSRNVAYSDPGGQLITNAVNAPSNITNLGGQAPLAPPPNQMAAPAALSTLPPPSPAQTAAGFSSAQRAIGSGAGVPRVAAPPPATVVSSDSADPAPSPAAGQVHSTRAEREERHPQGKKRTASHLGVSLDDMEPSKRSRHVSGSSHDDDLVNDTEGKALPLERSSAELFQLAKRNFSQRLNNYRKEFPQLSFSEAVKGVHSNKHSSHVLKRDVRVFANALNVFLADHPQVFDIPHRRGPHFNNLFDLFMKYHAERDG